MQTIDKDTNPWSGALDSHNSEQDNYGSEPESQTLSSRIAPPQSSATPDTNESPRLTVQVPREREGPVDPHVASLRAMFPDFDDTVL
jgi:hypothetical protein